MSKDPEFLDGSQDGGETKHRLAKNFFVGKKFEKQTRKKKEVHTHFCKGDPLKTRNTYLQAKKRCLGIFGKMHNSATNKASTLQVIEH